ncbi:MAG TPA: ankyrin repeat domain-containing protein [Armatimonadota bacterium]|nr:ankyrin repeat domain-containing protein [Armatimonadota bacterium]
MLPRSLLIVISLLMASTCFALSPHDALDANGTPMVPLRTITTWLGAQLAVNDNTRTITVRLGGNSMTLSFDNTIGVVNGKTITIEAPVTSNENELYIPLSLFRKAFNMQTVWDAPHVTAVLSHPNAKSTFTVYCDLTGTQIATDFSNAYRARKMDQVQAMVKQYPRLVNTHDQQRRAPLQFAVQRGWTDLAQFLIDNGADIHETFWGDRIAIVHFACMSGSQDIVSLLLDKGVDVNTSTVAGYTTMYYACQSHNIKLASFLLDRGASVNMTFTPRANNQGIEDTLKWLIGANGKRRPNLQMSSPLLLAALTQQTDMAKLLVEHGARLTDATPDEGINALHLAVMTDNKNLLEYLVQKGMDVNSPTASGFTPLHCACATQNIDVATWLLDHGADTALAVRLPDSLINGDPQEAAKLPTFGTPLMMAMLQGNTALEQLLLDHDKAAPVSQQTRSAIFAAMADVRTQMMQSNCQDRLAQLGTICIAYAQSHRRLLPKAETVWTDVKLPRGATVCPAVPALENGYGFNAELAGKDIRQIADRAGTILFAECKSADHIIHSADDIDNNRHGNGFMAVFCDGHAAFVQAGTPIKLK